MIIRVSEAHVIPARVDEFVEQLHALVADFPTRYDGLLSHEILIDINDPSLIQYISRWTDPSVTAAPTLTPPERPTSPDPVQTPGGVPDSK